MHRDYAPDETKRDQDQDSIKTAEADETEKTTQASAEKSSFTDVGDKPPVADIAEAAGPTASQRAFGGSDFDLEAAREWNANHPELVAEFNKLTDNACVELGTVDPEKVRDWQLAHGMRADGKVAAGTVGKAKASVTPEAKARDTNAPQDTRRENAPEESQTVAKEALTPAPAVEIAAAAVTTETVEDDNTYMDATEVQDANEWNDKHEDEVAAFNKATHNSCVVKGKLDPKKVWNWQDNNGISADGCVDTKTVLAAQDVEKAKRPQAEIAAAEAPVRAQV
jgi:hypothetical protein